eukprot:2767456-Pyramimonas_sp.AAC.1
MEGGSFSKYGSRLRAAHTRLKPFRALHGLRASGFQNVVRSLAPRALLQKFQELRDLRARGFQNVATALAPRAFVVRHCKSVADRGRVVFKMWL